MTITAAQTIQTITQPRSPKASRKTASASPLADPGLRTSAQPKPATRSRTKATERRPRTLPEVSTPIGRSAGSQPSTPSPTKQSLLIALLERKRGATIDELMLATGWQAHSVRGVMSGVLRKRLGLVVQAELFDGIRHYRITTAE